MKYFVASDVCGCFHILKRGLERAGYDTNNPEHCFISCGNLLAGTFEAVDTLHYIESIPQKILLFGKYEFMLERCCRRSTFCTADRQLGIDDFLFYLARSDAEYNDIEYETMEYGQKRLQNFFNLLQLYYETSNFLFVHSWYPLNTPTQENLYNYNPNWRNNASLKDWKTALWQKPYTFIDKIKFPEEKITVFGGQPCSEGWSLKENTPLWRATTKNTPIYGEDYIGINGDVTHSRKINILVLEDD